MEAAACALALCLSDIAAHRELLADGPDVGILCPAQNAQRFAAALDRLAGADRGALSRRSEEHTSELQSLMRISYAVFCLKKQTNKVNNRYDPTRTQHTYMQNS